MRTMRTFAALTAALSMLLAACGGGGLADVPTAGDQNDSGQTDAVTDGEGGELRGELVGAGATFPTPLFQDWVFEYSNNIQPGVSVNYQSIGSGGGIEQFLRQNVDFGSSERYLSDEALQEGREERGCEPIQIPVVFGSVVIAFNDPALDGMVLTAETIAKIFDRQITRYNDPELQELNPDMDLPDQAIIPVHRSDGSGTTYVFVRYLAHEVGWWNDKHGYGTEIDWAAGTVGGQGNEGVSAGIQQNPGGFGYVNQAYAIENDFPQARVINSDGNAVYPTLEATTKAAELAQIPDTFQFDILDIGGDGFPITGTNWIFVWECGYEANTETMLKDFWTWATQTDEADQLALELGYAPLGPALKERIAAEIARINADDSSG